MARGRDSQTTPQEQTRPEPSGGRGALHGQCFQVGQSCPHGSPSVEKPVGSAVSGAGEGPRPPGGTDAPRTRGRGCSSHSRPTGISNFKRTRTASAHRRDSTAGAGGRCARCRPPRRRPPPHGAHGAPASDPGGGQQQTRSRRLAGSFFKILHTHCPVWFQQPDPNRAAVRGPNPGHCREEAGVWASRPQ